MDAARQRDATAWTAFQARVHDLKLRRSALQRRSAAVAPVAPLDVLPVGQPALASPDATNGGAPAATGTVRVVLVTGFESFNQALYRKAAAAARAKYPNLELSVFSDRDIETRRGELEGALASADVFFGSLIFDYDQVEWLRARVARVPVRLVFESALELMSTTQVGTFQMAPGGKKAGPPPAVKKLLGLFGSQREEDRLAGYLSFLKIGPKILKFFPMQKAKDLRSWCASFRHNAHTLPRRR